uniref:Golgi associated RAB2 interactor protein-like Rab2B-binding domain-containing protein n=1 Tax=Anolis carolinensis TaxID=28377 RepID=G1KUH8_ANOCA
MKPSPKLVFLSLNPSELSTLGLFNREMGPLQRQLQQGEYSLLKFAPMLESEFLQINKRGDITDVHNELQTVTVGVACTSPNFPGPNVLLLARPVLSPEERPQKLNTLRRRRAPAKKLELTRLLPLSFVKISVHNAEKQQLRFKLASGRTFYLQLCPQLGAQDDVFELWVKVINMVRPPSTSKLELQGRIKDPGQPANPFSQMPKVDSLSKARRQVQMHMKAACFPFL